MHMKNYKTILASFSIIFLISACIKSEPALPDTVLTDLTITQTTTPASVSANQNIVSDVKMSGPNQCYRFAQFDVYQQSPLLYDVRAKASIPNPDKGNVNCAPPVYKKDTVLSIPTHLTDKCVLRFYNGSQLFKADTVQVN